MAWTEDMPQVHSLTWGLLCSILWLDRVMFLSRCCWGVPNFQTPFDHPNPNLWLSQWLDHFPRNHPMFCSENPPFLVILLGIWLPVGGSHIWWYLHVASLNMSSSVSIFLQQPPGQMMSQQGAKWVTNQELDGIIYATDLRLVQVGCVYILLRMHVISWLTVYTWYVCNWFYGLLNKMSQSESLSHWSGWWTLRSHGYRFFPWLKKCGGFLKGGYP